MTDHLPAKSLAQAKLALDRERPPLDPTVPWDERFYVERGAETHESLITEALTAIQGERPFQWFYTGHTGAGKSTELNRIIHGDELDEHFESCVYSVKEKLDVQNLDYADLILAIAQAVIEIANKHKFKIPRDLSKRIEDWGKEISVERSGGLESKGKAGIEFNAFFAKVSSEIQAGGDRRKTIREKIRDTLTDFIHMIDELVAAIEKKLEKRVLIVLDTLDHVDHKDVCQIYADHWATISKPKVSVLNVVPLSILHDQAVMASIGRNFSLLPNIKVHPKPGSTALDKEGFEFFKEVISKLVDLDLFTNKSLQDLFRISGGMLRDMIGDAGDACKFADIEDPNGKVEPRHVQRVLDDNKMYFQFQLTKSDYEILKNIPDEPYPEGIDGMASLLRNKAVIFYPNGRGWFALNPAVQSMLDDAKPKPSRKAPRKSRKSAS